MARSPSGAGRQKATCCQLRTAIGFPGSSFGRQKGAAHPATAAVKAELEAGNLGSHESCERFGWSSDSDEKFLYENEFTIARVIGASHLIR